MHLQKLLNRVAASEWVKKSVLCFVWLIAVWPKTVAGVDTDGVNPIWMAGGARPLTAYTSFAISQDGEYLACSRGNNTVQIWRASDGMLARSINAPGPFVFSGDGNEIAALGVINPNVFGIRLWRRLDVA